MHPANSRLAPVNNTLALCPIVANGLPSPGPPGESSSSVAGQCAGTILLPGCVSPTTVGYGQQTGAVDVSHCPLPSECSGPQPVVSASANASPQTLAGTDLPATSIDFCLPPFNDEELKHAWDPLTPSFACFLAVQFRRHAQTLPDDNLDSRARLLQFIVEFIRRRGFMSTHWFRGKSFEQLRAVLQRDPSFSAAVRNLISGNLDECCDAFFHVTRYVCQRPPSYKSSKSVHFAETVHEIEPEKPQGARVLDPSHLPPFVASDLLQLVSPIDNSALFQLAHHASRRIYKPEDEPELEVQVVQILLRVLLRKELISPNPVTELDSAGLRDVLRRDPALGSAVHGLTQCDTNREDDSEIFIQTVSLLGHYFCWISYTE